MPDRWRKGRDVPRYFLHLRFRDEPDGLAVDEEGDEVRELSGLRGHVEATARDLTRKTRLEAIRHWQDCTFAADGTPSHGSKL
jgi:hypothetical protein